MSRRRVAVAVAFAFGAQVAMAAETATLPTVVVQAAENVGLDATNTAGSRLGLSMRDTPASVEAIDTNTTRERGDFEAKEAVTRTTGLTDVSTNGDGGIAYSARGFAGNNSVGVTEDGNRVMVGAGTVTGPSNTWGYERFEVLRGVGSIVNGAGTVGATVNAVRKQASQQSSLEALVAVGEHGTYRAGVGGTGALGSAGAFRIDAYTEGSNGFVDRGDSGSSKIMSSFRFDASQDVRLEVQVDHSEQKPSRYWGTPIVNGAIDKSLRGQNYNVNDTAISYNDNRLLGRVTWQAAPGLTIKDEVTHYEAKRHWRDAEYYAYNATTRMIDRDASGYTEIYHKLNQTGNRLEATHEIKGNRLVAGWEISSIDFQRDDNFALGDNTFGSSVPLQNTSPGMFTSTISTVPEFSTHTVAQSFYIEDAYDITDRLLLVAGLRNDGYRYSRQSLTGPAAFNANLNSNAARLGLTYRVTADSSVYGNYSTGSDPIDSLLSLRLANSKFKLTDAKQAELGFKQSLSEGKGAWTAALFRIEKDNIVTLDPNNPGVSVQGGKQTAQGIELGGNYVPAKNWRVDANVALTRSHFTELNQDDGTGTIVSRAGKRPSLVPSRSANLWVSHSMAQWNAGLGARYVGVRYADDANTVSLPAYTVYDATLSYRYNRNTTLRAFLRNLTDKTYATTAYSSTQFSLGDPRRVELVAELKF